MTTITLYDIRQSSCHSAAYGNAWKKRFTLTVGASGAALNADANRPLQPGDVVRIGWLPAGIELHDCLAIVSGAFASGTRIKLGFAYEDGENSQAVPQDDDYFHAALAVDAQSRTRADNMTVMPLRLLKPAYVIATIDGATQDQAGRLDVIVEGLNQGPA